MKKSACITTTALLILVTVVTGCSAPPEPPAGVTVVDIVEAIGAVSPDCTDEQRLTYDITLQNNGTASVHVEYIEPVLAGAIAGRVLDDGLTVTVDNVIEPDGYLTIGGTFRFDTSDLSKQDIDAIGHLITSIRVSTISVLDLPGRRVP